jgi:hypothetical protein
MSENKDRNQEFFKHQYSDNEQRLKIDREKMYRSSFVIEGEDLLNEIKESNLENLSLSIQKSLAFKEGLIFGSKDYNLNNLSTKIYLQNLFTSEESSIDRPYSYYIDAAIRDKISSSIRKIKSKENLSENELDRIGELIDIQNQFTARGLIDSSFRQRMQTVQVSELATELVGRAPDGSISVKPDKGHWKAILNSPFGEKVDKVLRKIVDMADKNKLPKGILDKEYGGIKKGGIEDNIYAEGFKDSEIFKGWLQELLNVADQRMDVVWFAWRLALIWEIPATIGSSKNKDKFKIADAPIGNDLFTWTAHLEAKRKSEFGLTPSGVRKYQEKNLTHTGYPLSIDHICPEGSKQLCKSYLHESIVRWKGKKGISLWEIWSQDGLSLGKLPWDSTELQQEGLETEELSTGSFGFWLLKRSRAGKILEDIRSRPSLRDISDPDFFAKRVRIWNKVLPLNDLYSENDKEKFYENEEIKPEYNPRNWWLAGILLHSNPELESSHIPLAKENSDKLYRTFSVGERWGKGMVGTTESKKPIIAEILNHAYQCGFLRENDIDWLKRKLVVRKGTILDDQVTRI